MQELKHTEGAWKSSLNPLVKNKEYIIETISDGKLIARVQSEEVSDEETEFNAKLISLSPIMLNAFIELKKSMDETIKWQNGGLKHLSQAEQDRYKIICDIINKTSK